MIAPSSPAGTAPVALSSADHAAALSEGQRLAATARHALGSADVLLGLLNAGGAAARLLRERGLTGSRLEELWPRLRPERGPAIDALERLSHDIARSLGAKQTSSLHLLLSLLRAGSGAAELLQLAGQDPARLRAVVLRALTGPGRLGERARSRAALSAVSGISRVSRATGRPVGAAVEEKPTPAPAEAALESNDVEIVELAALEAPASAVLYRERELGRLLDLLQAPSARIICVVGEPGSGRTALLAALSAISPDRPMVPAGVPAGGASPGTWIGRLHRQASPDVALVIDGCGLLGVEGSDGPLQLLATARAGRRWILTASPADLRRLEMGTPDLAAALETVVLSPLGPEELSEVVANGLEHLAVSSGVRFSTDALKALLRLSPRYPTDLAQPGRALTIAAVATARARRLSHDRVSEKEVAEVVGAAADIPTARLLRSDDERFRTLEERLAERVVGHRTARTRIADVLRRSYAGFRGHRPLCSLLLLGPTGVGKTETARAIADALFDGEGAMVRLDLSEYSQPHAVARLIGSPPGYVGYEEGGQLTEAIRRRPASVVLLDELEKAHREVLLVLLQVLEDGRLTDGRGRTVDFTASAIVMTSNLGSECYRRTRVPSASTILAVARERLPAELWNRIDEVLCYAPLKESELADVVARFARDSSRRLEAERGIGFVVDDGVVARLLETESDRSLGARPLRRAFERLVEGPIANRIVSGNLRPGSRLLVAVSRAGEITVTVGR